ncbi:hypothetical protein ACFWYW_22545 [Nonomuraea sp. NPDC059023]
MYIIEQTLMIAPARENATQAILPQHTAPTTNPRHAQNAPRASSAGVRA